MYDGGETISVIIKYRHSKVWIQEMFHTQLAMDKLSTMTCLEMITHFLKTKVTAFIVNLFSIVLSSSTDQPWKIITQIVCLFCQVWT